MLGNVGVGEIIQVGDQVMPVLNVGVVLQHTGDELLGIVSKPVQKLVGRLTLF